MLGALAMLLLIGCGGSAPLPDNGVALQQSCIAEPIFDGNVCFYEANRGATETVVLLHGIDGEARRDWHRQLSALVADYHLFILDLPGFGASRAGRDRFTPDSYARLLRFLTEQRGIESVHLVGHSMGGAIALYYAALYPEQVGRLVVADVAGLLHPVAYGKALARGWAGNPARGQGGIGGWVERMSGRLLEKVEPLIDPIEPESVTAARGLVATDFTPLLPRVAAPTLVVWGEADAVAPLRSAELLRWRLVDSRLVRFEGAGHMVMQQRAAAFNGLVGNFLAGDDSVGERLRPVAATGGQGESLRCDNRSGLTLTGHYRRIELRNCTEVVIRDARIGALVAHDSHLYMERVWFEGEERVVIDLTGSDLTITAAEVRGEVALRAAGSRVDLAAVDLYGSEAAIEARQRSRLILSSTRLVSPLGDRLVQDNLRVGGERRF